MLTASTLSARSAELFPNAYSTLLSVVQGLALGLLAAKLPMLTAAKGHAAASWWEAAATTVAVVLIYYTYVWFVLVARWAPTVFDTLIPFVLGGLEVAVAVTVGDPRAWLIWTAALEVGGIGALTHTLIRLHSRAFAVDVAFRRIQKLLKRLSFGLLLGVVFVGAALLYPQVDTAPEQVMPWMCGGTILLAVVMVVLSERTLTGVYADHGLNRWAPF